NVRLVNSGENDESDDAYNANAEKGLVDVLQGDGSYAHVNPTVKMAESKVGEGVDRTADQEIVSNIDASATKLRGELSSQGLPELVDRNALKHGREDAGD
ncbi:MAG: hypothetical protein Q9203_006680, partial [Teloschistes exilis]